MEQEFLCYYCQEKFKCFKPCIDHTLENHPDKVLKIQRLELNLKSGKFGYRSMNFNVTPASIHMLEKRIVAAENSNQMLSSCGSITSSTALLAIL